MKKKILIADDEPLILRAIQFKLEREGYSVISVQDGKDAMEKIAAEKPDLVITDLLMPYHSGLEIISFLRNELKLQTPVIVLSSVGLETTVIEAFNLGANDFITKPFSPPEVSIRVKKLLPLE